MKILNSKTQNIPKGCVITIGNFDGLHKGHDHLLRLTKILSVKKVMEGTS